MMIRTEASRFILLSVAMLTGVCVWNMSARVPQPARRASVQTHLATNATDPPPTNALYRTTRLLPAGLHDRGLAPLTRWAQAEIHRRMNPANCSAARFLLTEGNAGSGVGSSLHVIGAHLAHAIQGGLVLAWGRGSCRYVPDGATGSCGRFFLPITDCPADVVARNAVGSIEGHLAYQHLVPDDFRRAIEPVLRTRGEEILYWWRAQSAGYLARLNAGTMASVRARRRREPAVPAGTISAHIRHGDKHREMRLVEPAVYMEAAERLAQLQPLSFGARTYFVTSDSASAINTSRALASRGGWAFVASDIPRGRDGFVMKEWKAATANTSMHDHLLQLLMALEADAWVGTRGSNWNRLIDELRCVWVDKCAHVYVEVGDVRGGDYVW
jgi:hypothetical protein